MSLAIIVCHHLASLVMPIGDPLDRFCYPTLTLMMDSYIIMWRSVCLIEGSVVVYGCGFLFGCLVLALASMAAFSYNIHLWFGA